MAATALEPRGELYVTGGEISVTASDSNAHALWLGNNQSKRVISGGTVTSPGTTIILAFNQLLTISGTGIVESTGGLAIDMYLGSTLTITGGTVRNTGTGSAINSTSNCKLSITGGTVQTKTGTAINGSSGGLIEIGGDALITATDTVKNLIAITTSTGYTSEVLKITGGTITCAGTNQVIVSNGGKITIAGGSILNTIKNAYNIAVVRVDGDTQLDITGGLIRATDGQAFAVILNTTAQVTMSGGDIIADREDGSNYGVHMNQSAASTFTMTGGTITANGPFSTGVSVSGGSFTLQGGTIKAPGKDGYGCCVGAGTVSLRNGTLEGGYAALSAFSTPNEYLVAPGMVLRGGVQAVLEAPSVMAEGLLTQLSTAYDGSGAALGDLRTVDLSTIKYVRTVTDKSTITAEDVTISGTVGQPMDTTITMKLAGDTFAQNLSGAWLVNVPAGVTQTVTRVDDTTAAIRLTGTPTAACSEVVAGVVPLACLENTIVDVTLTANDSAKWSIVWPTITAQVGNVTVSGTIGTAMTETTVSVTITGSTFAEALSGTWITNAPAGITQTLTRVNDTTATITLIGTPAAGSTAALNVVIPASCLRNAQDDVTCGANANAKWAIGTATTATPAPTPTATPTPTPTATATATPTPTPTPTATATPTAAPTPTATPTATLVITVSIAPGNTFVQGQAGQAYIVTVEAGIPGFSAANNFVRATMDGHALNVGTVGAPGTDGSVADGSIILTLNEQYLNTLNVGKHMLSVEIKDAGGKRQTVTTTLTVTAPMTPPKTGDSTNLSLLLLLMGISMSAAILLGRRRFAKEK